MTHNIELRSFSYSYTPNRSLQSLEQSVHRCDKYEFTPTLSNTLTLKPGVRVIQIWNPGGDPNLNLYYLWGRGGGQGASPQRNFLHPTGG